MSPATVSGPVPELAPSPELTSSSSNLVSRVTLAPGTKGVALMDLRPGGMAEFNHGRFDVVTSGEFIPAGDAVEVVRDEQYRLIVRQVRE